MKLDYHNVLPRRYWEASYKKDIKEEIRKLSIEQINNSKGLYIYGDTGTGKTHLACALAKELLEQGFEVRFYNTADFVEKLRDEFNHGFNQEDGYPGLFRDTMNFRGILILDDIGSEKISDWVRERLSLIINKKYEDVTPMIFTSNCDLEVLGARLGDRVTSRLAQMTEIIKLNSPDKRLNSNETN